MKFLTKAIEAQLRKNAAESEAAILKDGNTPNHKPVLKVFNPTGSATWLFTELHTDGRLFGLCDLGMGEPELGYVDLTELTQVRGQFGLRMERDLHFSPNKTLIEYASEAQSARRIVA